MTPLMTLLIVTLGPLIAVFDTSGNDAAPDTPAEPDTPEGEGVTRTGEDTVADDLLGTLFDDTLSGLGENDTISGDAGNDVISGGAGDDEATGDAGADTLSGDAGNDSLQGGAGADSVNGGEGSDTLIGGSLADPFDGAADTLDGGAGLDTLFLSDGDTGTGGADADRFTLSNGETGAVTITDFNPSEDALVIEVAAEGDVAVVSQTVLVEGVLVAFDNGATALLQGLSAAVPASAILFAVAEDAPVEDTMPGDETVPADDPLVSAFTGTDDAEIYSGPGATQAADADLLGGDDTGIGDALNDTIAGGAGADMLSGAAGNDVLFSTSSDSTVASDSDSDTLDGGLGDDTLVLGTGDVATGGDGADAFILAPDVAGAVTVTDFDAATDMLVVEATDPDDITIVGQTTDVGGLVITLSSGGSILLQGVSAPIDPALLRVEMPGTSTPA